MSESIESRRSGRIELAVAIVLSCATLASTWCGYQATEWAHIQDDRRSEADTAERESAEYTIVGLQTRTFDGIELLALWNAIRQNDTDAAAMIQRRLRPQLQKAVEASLAAGLLTDPTVATPMERPEYVLTEEKQAKQRRADAARMNTLAAEAGSVAGRYVSLTLLFASVLFFGGIAGSFTHRRIRIGLAVASLVLFLFTFGLLTRLPISSRIPADMGIASESK